MSFLQFKLFIYSWCLCEYCNFLLNLIFILFYEPLNDTTLRELLMCWFVASSQNFSPVGVASTHELEESSAGTCELTCWSVGARRLLADCPIANGSPGSPELARRDLRLAAPTTSKLPMCSSTLGVHSV